MNEKNYYEILNVNIDSTSLEIKRSYRKLANKYHPDKNNGDTTSSEYFKKINIAYDTLSDISKREQYNLFLAKKETFLENDSQNNIYENENNFNSVNNTIDQNLPVLYKLFITPNESKYGVKKNIKVSVAVFCASCKGYGVKNNIICTNCLGSGQKIIQKVFSINIPKETYPGSSLRLKNVGHESIFHKDKGDILIDIEWRSGEWYMIDSELHTYYQISNKEIKKGIFIFKNYDGKKLSINIPKNIKEGQILRIKEQGWMFDEIRTDLYIEIRLKKESFISKILSFFS